MHEEYNVEYIPPNFKEGISVLGFMIKVPYILQALPWIAMVVIVLVLTGDRLRALTKLVIGAVVCGPVIFLAMNGINGESLFGFFSTVLKSRKVEKTYLYNPRVKAEIKPLDVDPGSVEMLPREKILLYMEKRRAGKDAEKHYETFRFEEMFFEEDEGFARKPYSYMTPKERREFNRKNKR